MPHFVVITNYRLLYFKWAINGSTTLIGASYAKSDKLTSFDRLIK